MDTFCRILFIFHFYWAGGTVLWTRTVEFNNASYRPLVRANFDNPDWNFIWNCVDWIKSWYGADASVAFIS
jgi:hypothetical protein